ncbi:hypothetical protein [Ruegeria discodermiae]|uniref:hypothetical protein n=1 Tax=Ruegeria discodermiae TaxID=3064389 RepID=UPI0035325F51
MDDAPTQMAVSATEVAIVANGKYYICDGTTTTEYTTGAVTNPVGVAFIDGYFVVAGTSGGRGDAITVSGLDDGTTFDALDFAFAENSPDDIVSIIEDHNELWLFGSSTVEVWYNAGASGFPFARSQGRTLERGCTANTASKEDNGVFWIGADLRAYRSGGSTPQVISTREVEEVIEAGSLDTSFIADIRGHKFFVVRFKDQPAQAYDLTTQLWCEFSTGIGEGPWIGCCSGRVGSAFYVGTSSGVIATLDKDTYQDLGAYIEAEAVSVPISEADYVTINKVHMNIEAGDVNAQGEVMLQVSKDGRTWGVERWRKLGKLGQFWRRVVWHSLGTGRRMQIRVRITDPVGRDIYGLTYE